jgi:small subunit ribosomal protein S16
MSVKIRLRRVGRKKQPYYRVVVTDTAAPRDGQYLDTVGFYNPLTRPAELRMDLGKVDQWMADGAGLSDTVASLVRKARRGGDAKVALKQPEEAPGTTRSRQAQAVAQAEAPVEPAAAAEPPAAEAAVEPAAEEPAAEAAEEPVSEPAAEATEDVQAVEEPAAGETEEPAAKVQNAAEAAGEVAPVDEAAQAAGHTEAREGGETRDV